MPLGIRDRVSRGFLRKGGGRRMAVELIARVPLTYDGRRLSVGSRFLSKSQADARILMALGRARVADPPEERPKRQYRRRDLTAEPE